MVASLGERPGFERHDLARERVREELVDQPPPGLRAGTQIMNPAQPETAQNSQ